MEPPKEARPHQLVLKSTSAFMLTLLRADHTVAKTLIGTVPKQVLATQLQTLLPSSPLDLEAK